jgi:glutamine synthetase
MSIAHAGNDHRLGANEAPPAILSVFLGDMLTEIYEQIEGRRCQEHEGRRSARYRRYHAAQAAARRGRSQSHVAVRFTGNKFEFRAVGSSQNVAFPATCLNVAVAESLDTLGTELEARLAKGESLEAAVAAMLRKTAKAHKRIIFNGNGYSDDWQKEAAKRKLLNIRTRSMRSARSSPSRSSRRSRSSRC